MVFERTKLFDYLPNSKGENMNQWRNAMLVLFLFMSLVSNTKATTLVNKNGFRDQHPDIYNVRYNQERDVLIADLNKTYYGQNTLND